MQSLNQAQTRSAETTFVSIILAVSLGHFINDIMQSMLPAVYPLLQQNYGLSFFQIGVITATFQITGSILQPIIGSFTDKKPLPYSLPFAFLSTMAGLLLLANAHHYYILLLGAAFVGFGSSIFHPEASRVARLASGGKHGFAQSLFQVGGNTGSALGPLIAAIFISQQQRIGWLAILACIGIFTLSYVSRWYAGHLKARIARKASPIDNGLTPKQVKQAIAVLIALMFAKFFYLSSMQNYYTFYVIDKFHVETHTAQILLFLYLGGIALGTILGGPIGDRIGTRAVIWVSILGVFPFTAILPFMNLPMTAILTVIIGFILASAFPAIVVYAQTLMPGKIGTVAGLCFGLAFGFGAISSAALGWLIDIFGTNRIFEICAFLPLLGLIAIFLPNTHKKTKAL